MGECGGEGGVACDRASDHRRLAGIVGDHQCGARGLQEGQAHGDAPWGIELRAVREHGECIGRCQLRAAGKQRSRMSICADPEKHQIDGREAHTKNCTKVALRLLLGRAWCELARDAVNICPRDYDVIKQGLAGHPVIGAWIIRRHAALISEKDGDPVPFNRGLDKSGINRARS